MRRFAPPSRRRGFAIFVVVMVGLSLSAFAVLLWHTGRTSRKEISRVTEKKQAEFLARGAQQHALLKFRFLPTELYDAVCLSIGKNPEFDFGRQLSSDAPEKTKKIPAADVNTAPGPMFYTGETATEIRAVAASGGYFFNISRSKVEYSDDHTGLGGGKADNRAHMSKLLNSYLCDIATLYPSEDAKGIIVVDSAAHDDKAMGAGWRDPFVGNYAVRNLRVLGAAGGRRYDRDSILLTTIGSVRRADQISPVTIVGTAPKNLSRTKKIVSKLEYGEHSMPNASTTYEDDSWYKKHMGEGEDGGDTNIAMIETASGRATEITTGIYTVSRRVIK